jgi:lipopolysaccharide export system protein LptC
VTAGSAVQKSARVQQVELGSLAASILLQDGPARLTARGATFDLDRNTMVVPGALEFGTSDGYRLTTSGVELDLKQQVLTGEGGVAGITPSGQFRADRMRVDLENRAIVLDGRASLSMQGTP